MYNYGYANNCRSRYCRFNNCYNYNRCRCGFNRCNCGLNNWCDSDILTFLLFRQIVRGMNCCCVVSPYA